MLLLLNRSFLSPINIQKSYCSASFAELQSFMNGLGSLKTRHIQRILICQLLSLSPHSTSLVYGTTIYDCGV
ncbi:hypothetical protein DA100_18820 [Vibrio sp. Hep-1b-8]|nr:hypothetical protein DA100_18820 [Vibrio sp. Hep-1b-8]